jgi:hypothetical protein
MIAVIEDDGFEWQPLPAGLVLLGCFYGCEAVETRRG